MSDVNTFIDAIGADVNTAVAPRVKGFTDQFREKTFSEYGPRISAFASHWSTTSSMNSPAWPASSLRS